VKAMNRENFRVRMQLEAVERFQKQQSWEAITEDDANVLHERVAGLPSEIDTDEHDCRLFDFTVLTMQVALATGDPAAVEKGRLRVIELAELLEEKSTVPAVRDQLAYLASVQESTFWDGIDLNSLEEVRLRLRGLMPFVENNKKKILFTAFEDDVTGTRNEPLENIPNMTGVQYQKEVKKYLENHTDHLVIQRLRTNTPLTPANIEELEQILLEIGQNDETLLKGLLNHNEAPSLAYFIRTMVGLDHKVAQVAFSEFLSNRSLNTQQIRFVEMIIEQLMSRGVMRAEALYEQPFSDLHSGGPEALFADKQNVIEGIFQKLESMESELLAEVG
jgi:type I restriction enzyme R subunit